MNCPVSVVDGSKTSPNRHRCKETGDICYVAYKYPLYWRACKVLRNLGDDLLPKYPTLNDMEKTGGDTL